MAITRFGISLEQELLAELDNYVESNNFPNRSRAIAAIIEQGLTEERWRCNHQVAGVAVVVYDIGESSTKRLLSQIFIEQRSKIISVQQTFLTATLAMENVAVRGTSAELTALVEMLSSVKGVRRAKLAMTRID